MDDILHLYSLPYNPKRPLIVFDERLCFLIGDVLTPIPMEAGHPKREHYEYAKNGCCTVFLAFEPAPQARQVLPSGARSHGTAVGEGFRETIWVGVREVHAIRE